MLKLISSFSLIFFINLCFAQFSGNQTPTYPNLVNFYDSLAQKKQVELFNMGQSDYGLPIYLCVLNGAKDSLKTIEKLKTSTNIFINNGIHPGEPDGINACGLLTLDYIKGKLKIDPNVTFSFILCYNVDGMMVRSSKSRANQNGPEEYGFRGNAQNLDLNRDFIKMDSENAFTFVRTFHLLKPSVFVDTHVSDGADYKYTLTLIHSMKERLTKSMKKLTYDRFIHDLGREMDKHDIELIPYVEMVEEKLDKGIHAFNDLPRYAMGYASLFPCLSITTETHMLKPFPARVKATQLYLSELITWTSNNQNVLSYAIKEAYKELAQKNYFYYNYKLTNKSEAIFFKGYEQAYKKSEVTDLERMFYDKSKPFTKQIPYYNEYKANDSTRIPKSYIIGAQCKEVIKRLEQNNVEMVTNTKDTTIDLTYFVVKDFKNGSKPYEGHYLHNSIQIEEKTGKITLKKGDKIISLNQQAKALILNTLEPEAEDSYFAWNFFDSYVQEKEYFSDYVFEDIAAEIIKKSPDLKQQLGDKKKTDVEFAQSQWQQLYFIYQNSEYFEPSFMRLPVYKVY
jgi:hypothetical protein